MKTYVLIIFLLLIPAAFAQSLTISVDTPQNVEIGDTFTVDLTIRNTGSETVGTDLSPVIATLVSTSNCIINSAKIVGIIAPGESKHVSWVVTAPVADTCTLSVLVGSLFETYARESRTVNIGSLPAQASGASSAQGAQDGQGGQSGQGSTQVASNASTVRTSPTLEPGSVPEPTAAVENKEMPEETPAERSTKVSEKPILFPLPIIVGLIIFAAVLIIYAKRRVVKTLSAFVIERRCLLRIKEIQRPL